MRLGATCLLKLRQVPKRCVGINHGLHGEFWKILKRTFGIQYSLYKIQYSDVPQPGTVLQEMGRLKQLAKPQAALGSYEEWNAF